MIHLFLFSLLFLSTGSYVLDETKDLKTVCRGPQGITCSCRLALLPLDAQEVLIVISSCFRRGGWSDWSSWSGCGSNGHQKRRRACTRPTPIGRNSSCEGRGVESRQCQETIPEYFWGRWTAWSAWGDCRQSSRIRTRQCLGRSCEGCDHQTATCRQPCLEIRRHSSWTRWIPSESKEYRFQAVAVNQGDQRLSSEIVEESRLPSEEITWTEWEIRRGVALRYLNSSLCRVDTKLLALSVDHSRIPVIWVVYSSTASMAVGFLTHCLIFACCRPARKRPRMLKTQKKFTIPS